MDDYIIKGKLITPDNCDTVYIGRDGGSVKGTNVRWHEGIPYVELSQFKVQLKAIERYIFRISKTIMVKF